MIVGSGVDVIEIARIERALCRQPDRFLRRVFTPAETASGKAFARPALHFALGFAAKEAAMKALGTGWAKGVRWVDIETRRAPSGWQIELHGRAREHAAARGDFRLHWAPSRTREHAFACVVLEVRP